ncbi:terminase small subunit [Desulfovibrio sp. JY]|nr:terminase small subunit [Desulfovibrio sp. JY]
MGGKSGGLNKKQQRFVEEYIVDLNATQAAIRAGYSQKTAYRIGHDLLQKTSVSDAIETAMAERSERTKITADAVLQELARLAFSDIRKVTVFGGKGVTIKESAEIDDATAAAISEVSETTTQFGGSRKVKMHDKVKALELAGRHLGLFEKDKGPGAAVLNFVSMCPEPAPLPDEFKPPVEDGQGSQDGQE